MNQKGGCGKTITAINLSAFLARMGKRVLLVDMDPQGHATLGLCVDPSQQCGAMYDVMLSGLDSDSIGLSDVACTVTENLDVAPADILLSALPKKLSNLPGRKNILSTAFGDVCGDYDYAIIDCPPSLGLLTINALMACSDCIVPIEPSFFSLHGIAKMMETLEMIESETGHAISVRALVTLYTGRTRFSRDVLADIKEHLKDKCFDTVIRYSVKLAEAASHGVPITLYSKRCVGYADYESLAHEVLEWPMQKQTSAIHEKSAASGGLQLDLGAY